MQAIHPPPLGCPRAIRILLQGRLSAPLVSPVLHQYDEEPSSKCLVQRSCQDHVYASELISRQEVLRGTSLLLFHDDGSERAHMLWL